MNKNNVKLITTILLACLSTFAFGQPVEGYKKYTKIIKEKVYLDYKEMWRPAGGIMKYPFLTPGSDQYPDVLWDWDSWLSNIALRQILSDVGTTADKKEALAYEQGCILNFLSFCNTDGWVPITINRESDEGVVKPENIYVENMHKPCLAQHAAFLVKENGGDAEWLREQFFRLQYFIGNYTNHSRDAATGLYYWQNDVMIGVDNDPCTFYRPPRSSGSIYLNCLMYKELEAMVYLCNQLDYSEIGLQYQKDADNLKNAIQEHCWDERDGFFYSVDLNLLPVDNSKWGFYSGAPRNYNCLIQRIGVWSGFMALWAGIATPEQAKRIVEEHYKNMKTFNAPYGVRTLSKMEKMYNLKASGNPSSWLGPVWGVSNYMTWMGLVKYGFKDEAEELASKSILLFGRDFERFGALHECYQPENGEPILNAGFQNWNYLVLNMVAWMENKKVIQEF
uniref:MGH1-like glycoside hydrolase domain-containing protein n=1 Tax=uncultured Draconibacterium sp. TaxID=1573823 RepID=UPI003217A59D